MTELPIPTVLSLPAVSVHPSIKCLQFSQDGQAVLLTKHAVYILTPATGINVERSSVIKQALDSKPLTRNAQPLDWLRTMVEFDRSIVHQWPADCTDWGAVSLGSLDPSLQAVALSPSNLTADAGCVLALLNSNLELTIWGASKNLLTGQWTRLQDVTSTLEAAIVAGGLHSAFEQTLKLQSTCIEWSSQPDWNLTPAPFIDASLLAVGNRAGSVIFLRYDKALRHTESVLEISVSDRWVTHLAWSAWSRPQDGTCEAMLACGTSDGSVFILSVRQTLSNTASLTQLLPHHAVSTSVETHDEKACGSDGRAITGMRWANVHGRSPILIYHKASVLSLWSATLSQLAWSGSRTFSLRTQKRSVGSSALCPASGICYVAHRDLAVVSLSDGSFDVVYGLSIDPSVDPPASEDVRSEALSAVSRSAFVSAETEKVSLKDIDRINGMTTYDGCSTFTWTYEASRPTDFSYKHDAKHISTFVVAQLWDENVDDLVIIDLAECVGHSVSGETPVSLLRPIFLHLRDPSRISRLHARILGVLSRPPFIGAFAEFAIPMYAGDWTPEVSREVQKSLTTHLFGWDNIQSLRIRYAVAVFCQNHAEASDVQQKFADAANLFLANIHMHIQLTLMRHLSAISRLLVHQHDISFARRTIHQAASPKAHPALAKETDGLLARLPAPAPHPNASIHPGDADSTSELDSLNELCPACNAAIPLSPSDAESAACTNGHIWARCCITSFLLATPIVRTCIGCGRKAFLPPPAPALIPDAVLVPAAAAPPDGDKNGDRDGDGRAPLAQSPATFGSASGLPSTARLSWFVRDLLDATRRCPFCGNNFVVLV